MLLQLQCDEFMFTPEDRGGIRDAMTARAKGDDSLVAAALVGSIARGMEDKWSDVDLALRLAPGIDESVPVRQWTDWMRQSFDVADTFDVLGGGVRYRVFLLKSSLQIDVSFWPYNAFRATEPGFCLLFGEANHPIPPLLPEADDVIGRGWLYALHTRSAIARGKTWQSVMMLDDLRNSALTLHALHHGLNPWHGREVDRLTPKMLVRLGHARAREVTGKELQRSLHGLIHEYLIAVALHDAGRRDDLAEPLSVIASPRAP